MSRKMSMEQLSDYLSEQISGIGRLEGEIDEIQVGFNSAYMEFKAKHDQTLLDLAQKIQDQYDAIDPSFRARIEERRAAESERLAGRRVALREEEIPATRAEADKKLRQAREAEQELEQRNPRFDEREETEKARLKELAARMETLNAEIGRLRKGLGFITHYPRILQIDQQRNRVIGEIEATRKEINDIRIKWKEIVAETSTEAEQLKAEWRELSLRAARLQDELDYLDNDELREDLAQKRAITQVLDETDDPAACQGGALHDEIQEMIHLNIQTDSYQAGLGTVASMIALLRGVRAGFDSFKASVDAIVDEQRLHRSYLPKLSIQLPDVVESFNRQWEGLRKKVEDETRMARYPQEFVAVVQPALDQSLGEESISRMFDTLGRQLTQATAGWRG